MSVPLHGYLRAALTSRGHIGLTGETQQDRSTAAKAVPTVGALSMFWAVGAFIGFETGLSWPLWVVAAFGLFVVFCIVNALSDRLATILIGVIALATFATATVLLMGHEKVVFATHGASLVILIVLAFLARQAPVRDVQDVGLSLLGVARSAPLLAPVVLVFVFLPALSADVWRVADHLDASRLIVFAILAVGVLFIVVSSLLRTDLETVIASRARELCGSAGRAELTREVIVPNLSSEHQEVMTAIPDDVVDSCWPDAGWEYAPYVHASESRRLLAPLRTRLGFTTMALGILISLYVYALAAVTVDTSVAEAWVGHDISTRVFSLLGLSIEMPGGPYLLVALFLGVVATATFLSFSIIEDRFATTLAGALVRAPVDRLLVLALPYIALEETTIETAVENQPPFVPFA